CPSKFVIKIADRHMNSAIFDTCFFETRPKGTVFVVDIRVIALDDGEMRHPLAGNWLALTLEPALYGWLRHFVWRIVQQRSRHDIAKRLRKMHAAQFAHLFGERLENVPVGFRLPTRRNGLAQWMNK